MGDYYDKPDSPPSSVASNWINRARAQSRSFARRYTRATLIQDDFIPGRLLMETWEIFSARLYGDKQPVRIFGSGSARNVNRIRYMGHLGSQEDLAVSHIHGHFYP